MPIRLVVAVTDQDWYEHLCRRPVLEEVNFWAPSGTSFKALGPGELFLFKLHSPRNYIVGGGIFAHADILPCWLAWQAFGQTNGARTLAEMRARIARYRRPDASEGTDFLIGCRILTQPFFFDESNWIPVPASWSPNIVSFKTYRTDDAEGLALWETVNERLALSEAPELSSGARLGEPRLVKPRLGQGAFRALVTDIYGRRCAVTRERTLPALEAAHIRPYSDGGPHEVRNGLLLRRDVHSLFDTGYVTVTPDLHFEVSKRIREEFDNGKHYYDFHGRQIITPNQIDKCPDPNALAWHNENCFKG